MEMKMTKQLKRNVFFASLTLAAIGLNLLTCAQPSPAATLTVSLKPAIPGTPTTNLTCPTSLSLTALAIGTPSTPLQYGINSHFNGRVAVVTPITPFTLPASGAANVTVTVAIPNLTGSDNYVQLSVTSPAGPSEVEQVAVSCAPPPSHLAVPTEFKSTENVADCTGHFEADAQIAACTNSIAKKLVLTWFYDQDSCTGKPCEAPDGFNILRSDHGASYLQSAVQNQEPGQTAIVLDENRADAYGACFKVQAYKGKSDIGEPSAPFCVVPDPVTLDQPEIFITHDDVQGQANSFCPASGVSPNGRKILASTEDLFNVGYLMQDNSCSNTDTVHQSILRFDLTHLPAFKIHKATLGYHVAAAEQNAGVLSKYQGANGVEYASETSCAVAIGTPTNWVPGNVLTNHVSYDKIAALPSSGSDGWIYVDVTDAARKWASSPNTNFGVVLSPKFATTNDLLHIFPNGQLLNQECVTIYDHTNLKITF
jgi:hypothetical protein